MAAPGWYPDPSGSGSQRYWDGVNWTGVESAAASPPPPASAYQSRTTPNQGMSSGTEFSVRIDRRRTALVAGGFVVAAVAAGVVGGGENSTRSVERSVTPQSEVAGRSDLAAPAPTTRSGLSPAQENVIEEAMSYLRFSSFSRQGLIDQLEYSKYSNADAEFAVRYLELNGRVDWNQQAVESAKDYLRFSSFSLQGLIDQLEYSKFTPAQAQYGAAIAYSSGR